MRYKLITKYPKHNSFLSCTSNVVNDIGIDFLKLTSYSEDEIINKNINDVFLNLLKLPDNTMEQINLKGQIEVFLFTKSYDAREVTISVSQDSNINEKTYIIIEKPHSRLEGKFPYLELSSLQNMSCIAIYSADLILLKANQNYINLLDEYFNVKENCIGQSLFTIFKGLRGSDAENHWKQIAQTGKGINVSEFAYVNIDKRITYWDASCVPIFKDDKIKYLIHNSIEVTERILYRKQIEEQNKIIQQQKEQLETIMNNVSDVFFLIDKQGNLLHINNAGKELLKTIKPYTGDNFNSNLIFLDMDGNEVPQNNTPISKALRGERILNEKVFLVSNSRKICICVSATPIFNISDNLIEVVFFLHDITNQEQLEKLQIVNQQQLIKLEKDKNEALKKVIEMKDDFISIISHEFKTPITVINSAIQAMEVICKNDLSDKAKGYLNKIRQNANRQLKLVNNLLDITRINSGHLKINKTDKDIVFLTKEITESIAVFAEQKGIKLSFFSTLRKKIIGIDEEKYERILLNLLSNAVKFTPEGKKINVLVSQKLIKGKCEVSIQVRDEGVGIPDEKKELVFERFGQVDSSLTRQAEGTGIGLYLVKMLVEIMGGDVILESKVNVGSTFTILLPITKTKETPIEQMIKEVSDKRIIQAIDIEFSDIYL